MVITSGGLKERRKLPFIIFIFTNVFENVFIIVKIVNKLENSVITLERSVNFRFSSVHISLTAILMLTFVNQGQNSEKHNFF